MATPRSVVKADEDVIGKDVKNTAKEDLGEVKELILDKFTGKVAYVVLESGTFLGMGGKLFAIPWNALTYDLSDECFILKVDKEKLQNAPGFDQDHWPDMADRQFGTQISSYYGTKPFWK